MWSGSQNCGNSLELPVCGNQENDPTKEEEIFYLASFPSPTQLFVACSTEKRGEPGIFSHVSMM